MVEVEKEKDFVSSLVETDVIVGLQEVEPNGEPLFPDQTHGRDGIGELIAQQQDDWTQSKM